MPTYTFYPAWAAGYVYNPNGRVPGYTDGSYVGAYLWQGRINNPNGAILYSMLGFNSSDIRSKLGTQRVTGMRLYATVDQFWNTSNSGRIFWGTHNYTSVPSTSNFAFSSSNSRLNAYRQGSDIIAAAKEYWFDLGAQGVTSAQAAQEFQSGASTGFILGPDSIDSADGQFRATVSYSQGNYPKLVIYTDDEPYRPNAATLVAPSNGAVLDNTTTAFNFDFVHNDPNNSPMKGFYFARVRSSGEAQYFWNGTGWQLTSYMLPASAAPVISGSTRRLTIPIGKWGNKPSTNPADGWALQTVNNYDITSTNVSTQLLYPSAPPSVSIQQPTGAAYRNAKPTLRWTFSDQDGNPQYGWIGQIYAPEQYNAVGFNPDNYTGQLWSYSGDSSSQRSAVADVTLENHKTYRAYMKVVSSPNPGGGLQYSSWQFTEFSIQLEPPPPRIVLPKNSATVDLQAGFTLDWENIFSTEGGSQQQAAFAIRRFTSGGVNQWWDGAAWSMNEFYASGTESAYSFRRNEVTNGKQYTFAVSIRDGYGLISGYSSTVTVAGSTAPQVTIVGPPGFITTVNPTVAWTMYDLENDPQQTYQVKIVAYSVYNNAVNLDPVTVASVWDSGEVANANARNVKCPVQLDNGSTYRVYVRILAGAVYSAWMSTDFTVSLIPPSQPIVTAVLLPERGATQITIQGRDSMLTPEASRTTDDWISAQSCTISLGNSYPGGRSGYAMRLTGSATNATMRARTVTPVAVVPNLAYTAAVSLVVGVNFAPVASRVGIEFINGSGTSLGVTWSQTVSDASAIRSFVSLASPSDAATARMWVEFAAIANANDVHIAFDPIIRPSTGVEWSPGGLLGMTSASVTEKNQFRIVRQGLNIPIPVNSQQVVVIDEEIPIGALQSYDVVMRAVYPVDVLVSDPVTTTAPRWSSGWLWISDPLTPNSGKPFGPKEFGSIERPERSGKFNAIGRADAIFTRGVRMLEEGSFTIITHTREERESYFELADIADIVLLRIPPDRGEVEGDLYYVRLSGNLPSKRLMQHRTPHREIEQSWTRQARPLDGLVFGEEY